MGLATYPAPEWSTDRWWTAEEYARFYRDQIGVEEIDSLIREVTRVFDPTWERSTPRHPVNYYLFSKGLMPLQFLSSVGKQLNSVRESTGLRELIEALRRPDDYEGALFELGIAAALCSGGLRVDIHPRLPNGKCADILATYNEEAVYLELKVRRESLSQKALDVFRTRLLSAILDLLRDGSGFPSNLRFDLMLDSGLASLLGSGPEIDLYIIDGLIDRAVNEIRIRLQAGEFRFAIPYVGQFVSSNSATAQGSGVISERVSAGSELKRILQQSIHEAAKQLSLDHPGIVVIQSRGELDQSLTELGLQSLFIGRSSDFRHISAVIFVPLVYSIPRPWSLFRSFAVRNPSATSDAGNLRTFRVLSEALLDRQIDIPG